MKISKTRIIIPSVVVLLALAAGGAQLWGQHVARLRVDAALASLPGGARGQYGSLHYNVFTRTLRLKHLRIEKGGAPVLTATDAVMHHLHGAGTTADPYAAGKLRVDGLQVWRLGHHLTASYVIGSKIALLAPGIAPPATTPLWLARPSVGTLLAAQSIEAAAITFDDGSSIGALTATGYKDGVLQQASLRSFADRTGDKIGSINGTDIDLNGLDRVFDTGRYRPGAPVWPAPRRLIGHLDLSGIAGEDQGNRLGIEHMAADDFAARPFALSPTGQNTQKRAFILDAAQALSLGSASLSGLSFTDGASKTEGTLGAWNLMGYGGGKLALTSFRDLAIRRAGVPLTRIGGFRLAGVNAAPLLQMPPDATLYDWLRSLQSGKVSIGKLQFSSVALTAGPQATVTMKNFEETLDGGTPLRGSLTLQGLVLPGSLSPELAAILTPIGLHSLVLDLQETADFNYDKRDSTIDPLVLTAEGLGSLKFSGYIAGLPVTNSPTEDPTVVLGELGSVALGPFTLTFTNQSLVQRILAMMAKQSGKTPEEVASEAGVAASFFAATVAPSQPDAGPQVAAFIAHPGELTLTAAPASPVKVQDLMGADLRAAQAALNLRLTANGGK